MTNDTRSPAEIENEIERQRAGLTDTLDSLQNKFSVESIARQVSDQFQKHGGDIGQSITDAVKRNPVGLALTGIGLAWLMLGDRSPDRSGYNQDRDNDDRYSADRYSADRYSAVKDRNGGYPNTGGIASSQPETRDYRPYSQSGSSYPASGRTTGNTMPSWTRGMESYDPARATKSSFGSGSESVAEGVSNPGWTSAAANAGSTAMDKAKSMGQSAIDSVKDMASTTSDKVSAFRDSLSEGTEHLSDDARQRVLDARERAMAFGDSAMDYTRQGREKVMDLFEEQPLIVGAVAMAFGAAIGAALPRSQMENDYLGEQRDQLFHEAEQIFQEEKAKLAKVAKAATDEAKNIAQEVRDDAESAVPSGSVAQAVADKAKSSFTRVIDATEAEAKRQHVGEIKKL